MIQILFISNLNVPDCINSTGVLYLTITQQIIEVKFFFLCASFELENIVVLSFLVV